MLNNTDIQPNATINWWIAVILTCDFKLIHVPAAKHTGADGLSRRREAPEDGREDDDVEDWIDRVARLMFEVVNCEETVFGSTGQGKSVLKYESDGEAGEDKPQSAEA